MSSSVWRHITLTILIYLGSILSATAQFPSWDSFVEQLFIEAEEHESFTDIDNLFEEYTYLHANPININSADSTELQSLGFLTDKQIEGIHYYIYRYGALSTVGELMLIPELDYHTRQLLSYFVTFGALPEKETSLYEEWRQMLTQGRSELATRIDIPLYQRAGYAPRTLSQMEASPSRYYTGNALYHNIRYNYRYDTDLSWGICCEKDPGEPIFTTAHPLPDHLSGYLQIGNRGMLSNLVIGNYRLRIGQGLVVNSDFALGKTMLMQGIDRQSRTIKPHRGTSEGNYCTGVASTLAWRAWEFTAFASYRKVDATLDGASIRTLKTDGYHRTPIEQARKGNTRSNLFGIHLGYAAHGLHLGATAMYQSFNRNFATPTETYKQYAPQGHSFVNASADYAWHHHRLSLVGETAIDIKGSLATLNMIRLKIIDNLHLSLLHRYYALDYWALQARSISTSSEIHGEQGFYLGAEWRPYQQLQVTAYADTYYFASHRYRVSAPSYGTDGNITIRYMIGESNDLMLRYRYRLKQRDVAEGYRIPNVGLLNEWTHRLKLQWEKPFKPNLFIKLQAEGCAVSAETRSWGYMANINVCHESIYGNYSLRLSGGFTTFDADYAARIYGYERGLLYAYNFRMYHGQGIRGYLLLQCTHKNSPRLTATAKIGATHYFDRSTIGSGAYMINACHQEDIQLQARYTF